MPRAKRPKLPVSDRSLHLWLSAVLGVWIGIAQHSFGLISLNAWTAWTWMSVVVAVMLSVPIVATHPTFADRLSAGGVLLAAAIGGFMCLLLDEFDGSLVGHSSAFDLGMNSVVVSIFLLAPILVIRYLGAWLVIWMCSWALRPIYRHFLSFGPTRCGACGFDQTGLPDGHTLCPECGELWTLRKRYANGARLIRTVCIATVVLAGTGIALAAVPSAVVRAHYHGLHVSRQGSASFRAQQGIGWKHFINLGFSDRDGRMVYLEVRYNTEISLIRFGPAQPLRTTVYLLMPPSHPGASAASSQVGFTPRAAIIAALEEVKTLRVP